MDDVGGETFSYRTAKDGVVRIFREGRCVLTLGGARGRALAAELAGADEDGTQAVLRRVNGNFERGNERHNKRRGGR